MELLDGVQAYIIIMDQSGYIVSMNKYFESKTGYTSDELQGKPIWNLLIDDSQTESFLRIFQNGLEPGETYENCWVSKGGEHLYVQWSVSPISDGGYDRGYLIGTGIDISQRKVYEKTLLESTEKYRSLVEDNPDGIIFLGENNLIYLNNEAQAILGYHAKVAERSSLVSRIHPYDREKAAAYFEDLLSRESLSHHTIDLEIIRPDSTRVIVEVKGITSQSHKENCIHLVIKDVSLQKNAENNLLKMNRQMENVLSSTDEIIIGLCKDMRVSFVNHSLVKLLPMEQNELIGMPGQQLFDLLSALGKERKPINFLELLYGDQTEEVLLFLDETRKYFEIKVVPLGFEEGALMTMYDITDRVLLNRQREKYYEAIACGITVQDQNGRILYANQNAADIIGFEKDEIKHINADSHNWRLVNECGEELRLEDHPWKKTVRTRKEINNFVMGFDHPKYKDKRWIIVDTRNVLEEDSEEKVIATFHDITAKVELDRIMREKEKLALAGQLAAGVAHEVKNPLTSSLGFLKLMKDEKKVNDDYLGIVLEELESINTVTSEFLTLAEPQSAKWEKLSLVDDILTPIIDSLESQLADRKVKINFLLNPSRQFIVGVKDQIKRLFLNIFKNSIEAMPGGGNIDVSVIREDQFIVVRIKDTGTGIAPDRLKHLGEPFYSIKEKGTGLGLLLCKKIAHEHKGKLVIKSVQGRGTIVEVSLPLGMEK
ncbi:PAS domain S-box protein [Bacillus salacetis]|uniref:PAS domain S-box protein n=1 Tax=Bacillus salacetis TaxID=2315464 RepID=UPI003BA25ADD